MATLTQYVLTAKLQNFLESEGLQEFSESIALPYINFAAKKTATPGKQKKEKNCTKGRSCGYSCIDMDKNCPSALPGQAKTYAEWMSMQISKAKTATPTKAAAKPVAKQPKQPKQAKPVDNQTKTVKAKKSNDLEALKPTSFTEINKETEKWVQDRGLSMIPSHDHTHLVMHRMAEISSSDFVDAKASGSIGPGPIEEVVVAELNSYVRSRKQSGPDPDADKAFESNVLDTLKAMSDMGGPPGAGPEGRKAIANGSYKTQVDRIIKNIINNPYRDEYFSQIRKLLNDEYDFTENSFSKQGLSQIKGFESMIQRDRITKMPASDAKFYLRSIIRGIGTIVRSEELRNVSTGQVNAMYKKLVDNKSIF